MQVSCDYLLPVTGGTKAKGAEEARHQLPDATSQIPTQASQARRAESANNFRACEFPMVEDHRDQNLGERSGS
jgi:hypothetical protein